MPPNGEAAPARVTVYIPTRGRAAWLGGAIESVLAQTYRDFRLVVSDNGSTDGTPEVVAGFDDPRIAYVRREPALDLNAHFNLCFEECRTELVCTMPDDDRVAPDFLAHSVAALDAGPRVGLAHAQVSIVDRAGRVIAAAHDMTGLGRDTVESGAEFIRRSMEGSYRVHATTALIRTEALRGCLLDHRDFPVTDFGHWMRLALRWDVAFLARPLASYRVHTDSYTSGAAGVTDGGYRQGLDRIEKFHEIKLRLLEEHGPELHDVRGLRRRARRAHRRDLVAHAALVTPERRLGETARALAERARLDPGIVLTPAAWRLLATGFIGRRGINALKQLLGRSEATSSEVTA